MLLHYGNLLWQQTERRTKPAPKLDRDIKTEVLIVGAGMSGNLAAYNLRHIGLQVSVVEAGRIGGGSSLANTGLLQYWSDIMLWELAEQIGDTDAVLFYEMCLRSMAELTDLNQHLNTGTEFNTSESIYYASHEEDREKLEKEYHTLKQANFPVEILNRQDLIKLYNIDKPQALRTSKDASVNPYAFIRSLSAKNMDLGVQYYEETPVNLSSIDSNTIETLAGHQIHFDHIVFATGYGTIYPIVEGKVEIHRTYAIASQVFKSLPWDREVMFWETRDPYLYFRMTEDKRIIVGGLDQEISRVETDPFIQEEKYETLKHAFNTIVHGLDIDIDYSWNALFGTSKDHLPFLGEDPKHNNHYYLLAYEGNGTCYSLAGANIIADLIRGIDNPYRHIVRLNR